MKGWWQDLRMGWRGLKRSPGFATAVVLTLALGTGANTAIFSVVDALLLRPLPLTHPERLVRLVNHDGLSARSWAYPDFTAYRSATKELLSDMSVYYRAGMTLQTGQAPVNLDAAAVSGDFFQVMGLHAIRGRTLSPIDNRTRAPAFVAVITRTLWQKRFDGEPDVVGRTINLDHRLFTITGVISAERVFRALGNPEIFVPMHAYALLHDVSLTERDAEQYNVLARLGPSTGKAQVQTLLNLEGRRLAESYKDDAQRHVTISSAGTLAGLRGQSNGDLKRITTLLWAGALLVLLIACANIMNLFLIRAVRRTREMAIRIAVGADRLQLARQLITESLLLCLPGAALGVGLAYGGLLFAQRFPAIAELGPTLDRRVLLYTVGLTVAATVAFGIAPLMVTLNRNIMIHLQAARASPSKAPRRLRRGLGIGQIALSAALLASAGLVTHTLINLNDVHPGFNPSNVLITGLHFNAKGDQGNAAPPSATLARIRRHLRMLPGVEAAGFATSTPLDCCRMIYHVRVPGYTPAAGEKPQVDVGTASDGFFHALRIPIVRGQGFDRLGRNDKHAVLINQAMARKYWPDRNPVGSRFFMMTDKMYRVAGVVRDFHDHGLDHAVTPMMYWRYPQQAYSYMQLLVRSRVAIDDLRAAILKAVHEAAPAVVISTEPETMSNRIQNLLAPRSNVVWCLGVFGGIALLLAAIGLYGVLAYDVAQRQTEMGVRMALGATSKDILWLILRQVLALTAIGIAIGAAGTLVASRIFQNYLFGIIPADPLSFLGMALTLIIVALFAGLIPAWRAARLDPDHALKSQ